MYFNAYFKEMKIGAQWEARQSCSSCVQLAPGQAALRWPHAKLALTPRPLPLAALPQPSLQRRPAGGRTREGSLGIALGITAPGRLLLPGEGGRRCFGWDARLCSGCSSQLPPCQLCRSGPGGSAPPWHSVSVMGTGLVSASPVGKSQSSCTSLCDDVQYLQGLPPMQGTVLPVASLNRAGFDPASPAPHCRVAGLWEGRGPAGSLSARQWALLVEKPL